MKTVQLTTQGIKKHLDGTTPEQALVEYIWNGVDAKANLISVDFVLNTAGGAEEITVKDNGGGIALEELDRKFGVFLDSEKLKERATSKRISSETHGKHGIGRLTFFVFANNAEWHTVYEQDGRKYEYRVQISAFHLVEYPYQQFREVPLATPTGTIVRFWNIHSKVLHPESQQMLDFLTSEFCWRLLLQENLMISANGERIIAQDNVPEVFDLPLPRVKNPSATVKIVHWKNKLHREYSRYYFLNSAGVEKYTDFTSLNKKGDNFFHSVYVSSSYFDNFTYSQSPLNQGDLDFGTVGTKNNWYRAVLRETDILLRDVRKNFLKKAKADLIETFEEKGILPHYNESKAWERLKHEHLAETVGELYNLQPNLFNGSIEQKKIFIRLIDHLLESDQAESLYQIIGQVLDLAEDEKNDLLEVLNSSRLGAVARTVKLIQDRYRAIEQIKRLNWEPELGAKEVPHIQTFVESHFWLLGEEFSLVVAAEKDFDQALRALYEKLNAELDKSGISHADKNKEMDVFLVRQDKRHDKIYNVVLELKHPKKKLGKKFAQQVETYFEVLSSEPRFNAANMVWSYYLIGNDFDSTGYIEDRIENVKFHGEPSLIYKVRNHSIYVKRWSEIIADVEIRHQFLNDRLEIQREVLAREESVAKTADEVVARAQELSCVIPK